MKNVFIKFGIAMVFLTAVFIACEQELFDKDDGSLTVEDAQSWFNANQPEFLVLKSGDMSKRTKVIKPTWRGAYASKNRKVEVVETHIMANGAFGFATKDAFSEWLATDNPGYLTSMSRIVVMKYKDTGEIVSFIMTIVGNKEYLEKKDFKLWDNDYTMKDDDFSGLVLYHSLKGKFVNGWRYTEGVVTHKVKLDFDMDVKLRLKGSYYDCTTVPVYGWFQDCTTNNWSVTMGETTTYNSETTCDDPYMDYVGTSVECTYVEDGDVDNSGGGSPGGYSPPIVDAIDLQQNPKADCVYNKLISGNVLNNFMSRYFGLTEPSHSLLGEIDLYWKIGDLSRFNTNDLRVLAITNPIGSSLNPNYYVEIILDAEELSNNSVSLIAYTMLHEAAHAKLIAKYYDQTGTTDFETLFRKNKNLYGTDVQHFTMLLDEYANELATGVKEFDEMFGVNRSLLFYQRAINYQLREQLGLNQGNEGKTELGQLQYNSPKTCE